MPFRLDTRAPDFASEFRALLNAKRETATDVEATVRKVIDDVIARGDRALVEYTQRFDRVLACKCRNVQPHDKDAVLNLLAIEFSETSAPAGVVTLVFSGGAALRLEVECLEAELADLGPVWTADKCPSHPVELSAGGVDASPSSRH